jgi:acetolactate synthase-1/2/3 large subunit
MPNFSKIATAYGIEGYEVYNSLQLKNLISEIQETKKILLIDVNVIENENCYPMVAPGRSNSQMLGLERKISN